MVLGFEKFTCIGALCFVLLLFSCTQVEYDNPYDPNNPNAEVRYSSSEEEMSSSSSSEDTDEGEGESSSSALQSSSSAQPSSNAGCRGKKVYLMLPEWWGNNIYILWEGSFRNIGPGTKEGSWTTVTLPQTLANDAANKSEIVFSNQNTYNNKTSNIYTITSTTISSSEDLVTTSKFTCSQFGANGTYIMENPNQAGSVSVTTEPPNAYNFSSLSARPSSSSIAFSLSSSSAVDSNIGSVSYGGQTYKTVKIGNQTWFAENLNYAPYATEDSKCYDNLDSNCGKYGRLYDWSTAMGLPSSCYQFNCSGQIQAKHKGICPSGWHIPSQAEWNMLGNDARKLKATSGWNNNGNGTNDYGFSALPGGYSTGRYFFNVGDVGYWWSATENNNLNAYSWLMNYDDSTYGGNGSKSTLFSVRCLQD